jgi:glycerate kinase
MATANLVMTGEGHLDPPSFAGKVPGGILDLARVRSRDGRPLPVLCIAGGADRELLVSPPDGMEVVSHSARFGRERARSATAALITQVTAEALDRFCS